MSNIPDVSIVVPCYNYGHYLPKVIENIYQQTFKNFEVIVVDDCSTDNSHEVAEQLQEKFDFYLCKLAINKGLSYVRHTGFDLSRGKYVLFLDPDDAIHSTYLEKLIPILDDNPNIGMVYPDSIYVFENGGNPYRFNQPEYNFFNLIQNNFMSYCMPIRKTAYYDSGGFNLDNWGWAEDWEMWIRMGKRGWYGMHYPEALFFYTVHNDSAMQSDYIRNNFQAFRMYFIIKYKELYPPEWEIQAKNFLKKYPENFMSFNKQQAKEMIIK